MKTSVVLSCPVLFACPAFGRCQAPTIEDVVADPADYAGRTLVSRGVALSGNITRYDLAGDRKYYLTVQTPGRVLEAGFFPAPPGLRNLQAACRYGRIGFSFGGAA